MEELIAEGDRVAERWTGRGTHRGQLMGIPPTGRPVEAPGSVSCRIVGGKIVEFRGQFDMMGLMQQLGAIASSQQAELGTSGRSYSGEARARMQERINDTATLEAAQAPGWQAVAIGEYEGFWTLRRADLRADLSARIAALTGQRIPPREIYADGHLAACGVDGATFRLYHGGDLVLVRECAYCSTDRFESPKIGSYSDLGYALSAWRPLHGDCEYYSSEECPDF